MQSIKSKILNKLYQKKVASNDVLKSVDMTQAPAKVTITNPFNKDQSASLPVNGLISVGGGALTGGLLSYLLSKDENKLRNTILGTLTGAGLAGGGYYAYDRFLRPKTVSEKLIADYDKHAEKLKNKPVKDILYESIGLKDWRDDFIKERPDGLKKLDYEKEKIDNRLLNQVRDLIKTYELPNY